MKNIISIDLETDSLDSRKANIIGCGFVSDIGRRYVTDVKEISRLLSICLKNNRQFVGQNVVFDCSVLYHTTGIDISANIAHDTLIMAHTIGEKAGDRDLDTLAWKYLKKHKGTDKVKESALANGGTWNKSKQDMHLADPEIIAEYCLLDCELTLELAQVLISKIEEDKGVLDMYNRECMPLYREFTIPTQYHGVPVNVEKLEKLQKELKDEIGTYRTKIYKEINEIAKSLVTKKLITSYKLTPRTVFGKWLKERHIPITDNEEYYDDLRLEFHRFKKPNEEIINITSGDQIGHILFKILKEKIRAKTPTGKPKTNAEALSRYSDKYQWIADILAMRKSIKVLEFADSWLEKQIDGRIYPHFNQAGTISGRFSSSEPNFQQVGDNRLKACIEAPEGWVFVGGDYSQLEAACFVEACNCKKLIESWNRNEDLYSRVAIDVFGLTNYSADKKAENFLKSCLPDERDKTKVFTLASVYGQESEHTSDYFETYPELVQYCDDRELEAVTQGYVKTKFGRKRYLEDVIEMYEEYKKAPPMFKKNIYWNLKPRMNEARNHPIQGLAAHICNHAMIKLSRLMKRYIKGIIPLQIHDEIITLVREEDAEFQVKLMRHSMTRNYATRRLSIPMKAEPVIAKLMSELK